MRRPFAPRSIYPPQTHEILSLIFKIIAARPEEALTHLDASSLKPLRYHRLTPWLYREVARKGWESYITSPSLLQDLRRDYMLALNISALQSEMTLRLVQRFSEHRIEVILLKGADLRHRLYGDPAARLMDDVDILIDRKDLPQARSLLRSMGFQPISRACRSLPGLLGNTGRGGSLSDLLRPRISLRPPLGNRRLTVFLSHPFCSSQKGRSAILLP